MIYNTSHMIPCSYRQTLLYKYVEINVLARWDNQLIRSWELTFYKVNCITNQIFHYPFPPELYCQYVNLPCVFLLPEIEYCSSSNDGYYYYSQRYKNTSCNLTSYNNYDNKSNFNNYILTYHLNSSSWYLKLKNRINKNEAK